MRKSEETTTVVINARKRIAALKDSGILSFPHDTPGIAEEINSLMRLDFNKEVPEMVGTYVQESRIIKFFSVKFHNVQVFSWVNPDFIRMYAQNGSLSYYYDFNKEELKRLIIQGKEQIFFKELQKELLEAKTK